MFVETDLPREAAAIHKAEPVDLDNQDPKPGGAFDKGGENSSSRCGGGGRGAGGVATSSHHQELTLSYMCDNTQLGFGDKDAGAGSGTDLLGSLDKARSKGKEVARDFSADEDHQRWVERDFLQLGGGSGSKGPGKRELVDHGGEGDGEDEGSKGKKPKVEPLGLSLGPPSLSLSLNSLQGLNGSNSNVGAAIATASMLNSSSAAGTSAGPGPAAAGVIPTSTGTAAQLAFADPQVAAGPVRRTQSNNTLNTRASSDDFSMSHSCSLAFSHNPSCSLTRNSTENYEYSRGTTDHIWYAGEGTNGSVHSRFRPVGEGTNNSISFSNHGGFSRVLNNTTNNRDIGSSSVYKGTAGSDSNSFFPSELPARSVKDIGKATAESGGQNAINIRPELLLKEILSESLSSIKKLLLQVPNEAIQAAKDYLKTLMNDPEKRDEFAHLQKRLLRRSDLTFQSLLHAHKAQIDILVTVKTGLENYLYGKTPRPTTELVEVFFFKRCRNVNCNISLPVEDCACDICSANQGFCSACMCPVCMRFDCAENTCSWVGCDVCSHWCHALCGIEKKLIKPGPTLKGTAGTTEMQFHCLGCNHSSEMFGFVKDVFLCCAKDWGLETLKKELDCVRRIFRGSEDGKGRELYRQTDEVLSMLEKKLISPNGACESLLQFLKYGPLDYTGPMTASKEVLVATPLASMPPKPSYTIATALSAAPQMLAPEKPDFKASMELPSSSTKFSLQKATASAATLKPAAMGVAEGFESLESMVQFKQAEAALFQRLADEARREVERYQQIARTKLEKLEEEYTSKHAQLCLQETEERRLKKLEELKLLENSHCDYYKMKIRMEAEMASLLERMEATKKQLA